MQIALHGIPYLVQINAEVVVDEHVAHSHGHLPRVRQDLPSEAVRIACLPLLR